MINISVYFFFQWKNIFIVSCFAFFFFFGSVEFEERLPHKILKAVNEIILILVVDILYCQGEPGFLQKCLRETAKDLVHND